MSSNIDEKVVKIDEKLMVFPLKWALGASWRTLGAQMAPSSPSDPNFGGPEHHFRGQRGANGAQVAPKMEPKPWEAQEFYAVTR